MKKKILLVEDNEANRKLLRDHLRRVGHEVRDAQSADDAVRLALDEEFDLIVMDVQLAGIDGLTVTRRLRLHPITKYTPILAVTANAMQGDREKILSAGCDGYVAKPFAYKDFLATVERLLANGAKVAKPARDTRQAGEG